jgi:predicted RNA-binding Zn ribbon-like protein
MKTVRDAIATPGHADRIELLGGRLCLDFVNTVEPRVEPSHGGDPREYLVEYADLVAWEAHAGALPPDAARALLVAAHARPGEAFAVMRRAIELREACYLIFLAIAVGKEPRSSDIAVLSAAHAEAMSATRLIASGSGFTVGWDDGSDILERPLWPIAVSAVELLTEGEWARIKDCQTGDEGCGWLFYDSGKNNSRRWCSMRDCGTLAKERRRAEKKREGSPSALD